MLLLVQYKDSSFLLRKQNAEGEIEEVPFLVQLRLLIGNPVYVTIALGYGAYMFTVGGLAFWGPQMAYELFDLSKTSSSLLFGVITIVCGFSGTLAGSVFADRLSRKFTDQRRRDELTQGKYDLLRTELCCLLLVVFTAVGVVAGMVGILLRTQLAFLLGLALADFSCSWPQARVPWQ